MKGTNYAVPTMQFQCSACNARFQHCAATWVKITHSYSWMEMKTLCSYSVDMLGSEDILVLLADRVTTSGQLSKVSPFY